MSLPLRLIEGPRPIDGVDFLGVVGAGEDFALGDDVFEADGVRDVSGRGNLGGRERLQTGLAAYRGPVPAGLDKTSRWIHPLATGVGRDFTTHRAWKCDLQ
ncbi:MAG: hypothetical protein H5T64_11110 [Chloroflexi bacterium]|nr:hypothetical protein [Chloroflexota bacterium]